MKKLKVLIIEDSEDDEFILLRHLKHEGYDVKYKTVQTADSMEKALYSDDWQIILSDYSMPKFDGLMALAILKKSGIDIPFIMISGTIGEETAVQAMLAGADDYFIKGSLNRLTPAIERELNEAENRRAHKIAQIELVENKKRLQLALRSAGLGVWELNLQNNQLYWSPECYRIFEINDACYNLEGFLKLIHPEDVSEIVGLLKDAIENHKNYQSECQIIKKNGEFQWIAVYGSTEYDKSGNGLRIIGTIKDITKRKHAEKAIVESEENLRAIIQATTQYVWTAKENSSKLEILQWFSNLSGQKINDIRGLLNIIHPEDRKLAVKSWQEALRHKSFFDGVFRFRNTNNEYYYIAIRSVPVYNSDGRFRQWVGTCNDISDRMKIEESLRKNEAQLQLISDTVPTLISYIDNQLNCLFVNKTCLEWFNLTKDEMVGKQMVEILGENAYSNIVHEIKRVLKGESFSIERESYLQGDSKYLRFHYVPDFDETGKVSGFFSFVIDLTANKLAQEKLRKSEERFRSLVNSVAQIVWTTNAEGTLLTALTPKGSLLEGTDYNLINGWISNLHPEDKERAIEEITESLKTKSNYVSEYKLMHPDGTYHYYISRGTPIFENNGTVREWVGTLTDITDKKLAEEKLRKSEEGLLQAQKLESVGRLAGGIAHDFNNMLTAINGYSDLTLRQLDKHSPLRHNIEEIKKAGERSAALTQQLLAFSRRQILQTKLLDLNNIISESIGMFKRLIGENIDIVSTLNPPHNFIKADPGQLSQMLLNLVVNSRDALPEGGTINIQTDKFYLDEDFINQHSIPKTGDYVRLIVSDNGIGINEQTLQQIFEPFFTTKEVGKGTGLGLSTVYGIVNQLGGCILVDSSVGVGTSFKVYLPIAEDVEVSDENTISNGNEIVTTEQKKGGETILLVEDEELVRRLSKEILETSGYKVIEAKGGFEALELCEKNGHEIDMLLTDVVMPYMSGRELAEKIKLVHKRIKILFASGYTEDAIVQHRVRDSEMNFIQKPFTFDQLTQKVRELFDNPTK
jgi:two-component system, cell cycle sensor histidine kinase and response regulator CckA